MRLMLIVYASLKFEKLPLLHHSSNLNRKTFLFVNVRHLSVLHGHSFFSSPPQRPMTSDFKGTDSL